MRRNQLNGHKSIVIWFTDLSDFGKLTLTHSVEEEMGKTSASDGDNVRQGLSSNLTFSNDAFNH
ncbi:adenylyl-sulfate kinase [Candidatus Thioglobus sp.]|nr:adenylyl-sulfate kinase [Candidatus Thioglobus sp.]